MACCKCCCGKRDCEEGDEGKCCCGETCCAEGEYCCEGVCKPGQCCVVDNDCPDDLAFAYTGSAGIFSIPDQCFAGGPGWTSSGGQTKTWEWAGSEFYCTSQEALDAAAAALPALAGVCQGQTVTGFVSYAAEKRCIDGACRWQAINNDPATLAAIEQCLLAAPP